MIHGCQAAEGVDRGDEPVRPRVSLSSCFLFARSPSTMMPALDPGTASAVTREPASLFSTSPTAFLHFPRYIGDQMTRI
jgi:hypothetical protein